MRRTALTLPRVLVLGAPELTARCRRILAAEREVELVDELEALARFPDVVLCVGAVAMQSVAEWRERAEAAGALFVSTGAPEVASPTLRLALRHPRRSTEPSHAVASPRRQPPRAPWPGRRVDAVDMARLDTTPWFSRVGLPLSLPPLPFVTMAGQLASGRDEELDEALLESMNQVSGALVRARPDRFARWNEVALACKDDLRRLRLVLDDRAAEHTIPAHVIEVTESVLLAAMMAGHFRDVSHRSSFAHELVAILAVGHIPVAWRGRWPNGALVVA